MKKFELWTGKLFPSFKDCGYTTDDHFNSDVYLEVVQQRAARNTNSEDKRNPLNLLISTLSNSNYNRINIVDFGGGLGGFLIGAGRTIKSSKINFKYINIDNDRILSIFKLRPEVLKLEEECHGRLEVITDNSIRKIAANEENGMTILILGSVLQYIEKESDLIDELMNNYMPDYLVFDDVFITKDMTAITTQKFMDHHEIPFKFLSRDDFEDILTKNKLQILFECDKIPSFRGNEVFYSTDNLPEAMRIERAKTLILSPDR